jgi:hypothetical protein
MALGTLIRESSVRRSWDLEDARQMTRKSSLPGKPPAETPAATFRYRPFTRLDHHGRATIEEFDRERMGIAAKE